MFKVPAVIHKAAMVLVCAGFVGLAGCGSSQEQADKAAKEAVAKADLARAKAKDSPDLLAALDSVQSQYDTLANDRSTSPQMQILLHGRQSQLRLERIGMMMADLRAEELAITRDISQINQLAMQVAGAQAAVASLQSYDPTNSVAKLSALRDQIQGSASQLTWAMPNPTASDPNAKVTSPTVVAIKQQIDQLNDQIQKNQADTDAAHKLSSAKGDEAEQYLRRAEGETGAQAVADTTKSADDRREAAFADAKAATLANDLVKLQASLDHAKDQQTALEAAVKTLNDQIQAQQTRWASIQEQIKNQQEIQQHLIAGSGPNARAIGALADDLAQNMKSAADLREKINNDVNVVVPQLTNAITMCNNLRQDWVTSVRERQDDPDAVIWKQAQETLHPMYFNLQVASALGAKATIAANKARIDQLVYDMYGGQTVDAKEIGPRLKNLAIPAATAPIQVPGLTTLLKKENTGVDMPAGFGQVPPPDSDALKQSREDADKAFQDTIDTYEKKFASTDSGPAAEQRKNLALAGEAHTDREWSQLAAFFGDSAGAQDHLHAATDLESQIDPSFTLAANNVGATNANAAGATAGATPAARPVGGVQQ